MDYSQAFKRAIDGLYRIQRELGSDELIDRKQFLKEYNDAKLDPDGYFVKMYNTVPCSADGLISFYRMCCFEESVTDIIPAYAKYRMAPIFFFPRESGGINQSRGISKILHDKIDYTLLDIKTYFEKGADACVLASAYKKPLTSQWLSELGSFKEVVDWFDVKGIFTNENYEVIDIENDQVLCELPSTTEDWSRRYYERLKKLIEKQNQRGTGLN